MATWLCPCTLSLLLLLLSLQQSPLHASDTLTINQRLSGNQKLISQEGNFALGFFQPAAEGSNGKWYIGIWYNKIPKQTIVWVANREKPISDPASSSLTISDDGNFVLLVNHSKSPLWSTNIMNNTAASSTIAVLLDNGNLLVRHESNTSAVLWQSFDDFTDTWLPGNKLSRNKKTGVIKRMISWKDLGDPAPGMYSIQLDPNGSKQYILQWNNSEVYWTTGKWTKNGFTGVPEMSPVNPYPSSRFLFQFVDNDEEAYFTYNIKDDALIFTRTIIDVSGLFQTLVWAEAQQAWTIAFTKPKAKCSVYGACGEYSKCSENAASPCSCLKGFSENQPNNWKLDDWTTGCRRNIPLQCGNNGSVKHDSFYAINSVKLADNAHRTDATNVHDCELICLNNCSCTAYSHSDTCLIWYTRLMNLQDNIDGSSDSIFIRVAASELSNSGNKKLWLIGIIISGFIILCFGVAILYFLHRRRTIINGLNHDDGSLTSFRYIDLQLLTRNFSERLGGGSFGSVFKGVVPDTTAVAVKKLEGFHQGEKQFRAEVSTIGNIHHINLIRLLGFCSEGTKRLLVYEYMPNGSLDKHLFGSSSTTLNWKMRYQIAIGIAKGLAYLHEECRDCIIHCDVKPQNILLDASFVPKVADFGLAKLLGRDFSRVLTSMRGTVGYLAPEWISGEAITTKADVFSYGMVLFEIISGRRNLEHKETRMETFFPVLIARKLLVGDVQALLGEGSINAVDERELERVCRVACWCVQGNESSRPTMGEIVKILEGVIDVDMPPLPRYLEVLAEGSESVKFFSCEATKCSC